MRKTKIICTLGPTANNKEIIKRLIKNGLDGARINFSHGTRESLSALISELKAAREELNAPIPLILDTKGPEIRVKTFSEGKVYLEHGDFFTLTTRSLEGNKDIVSVTYSDLPKNLSVGSRILLDDGLIELSAEKITETDILCRIISGGFLSSRKGINIPNVYMNMPSLTAQDIDDLKFGVQNGFDFIAASFIRNAKDINNIRRVLKEAGGSHIHIIAKIENREGVNNIDEILETSDGIMIARGDLGVEIPLEEVPLVQKQLIKKAHEASKPVITATQMLESMIKNPRPTRAEASDVANAIFDGSDCIMLSGETASGDYPVESVIMMSKIAEKAESSIDYLNRLKLDFSFDYVNTTNVLSYEACAIAAKLSAACIATITKSGFTARMISKFRPPCPIAASSFNRIVWRQLSIVWGCIPVLVPEINDESDIFLLAKETAEKSKAACFGDTIVTAIGVPVGVSGSTNTLRVDVL